VAVVEHLDPDHAIAVLDPDRAVARAAVAKHVGGALADRPAERVLDLLGERAGVDLGAPADAGRLQRDPRAGQLRLEGGAAIAADRLADLGERLARDPLDVGHLGGGLLRRVRQQPAGQFALEGDQRQAVAEQVVQVPREAQPLLADRQARDLLPRGAQRDVRLDEAPEAEHRHAGRQRRQHRRERQAVGQAGHRRHAEVHHQQDPFLAERQRGDHHQDGHGQQRGGPDVQLMRAPDVGGERQLAGGHEHHRKHESERQLAVAGMVVHQRADRRRHVGEPDAGEDQAAQQGCWRTSGGRHSPARQASATAGAEFAGGALLASRRAAVSTIPLLSPPLVVRRLYPKRYRRRSGSTRPAGGLAQAHRAATLRR
jgi:hypothetical protein